MIMKKHSRVRKWTRKADRFCFPAVLAVCCAAMLLLLCGCRNTDIQTEKSTIAFYYRTNLDELQDKTSALGTQPYSYSTDEINLSRLLVDYFAGPSSDELETAFPKGTAAAECSQKDNLLIVRLSGDYARMSGIDKTIANACLTLTVTQINGIERLCILAGSEAEPADGNTFSAENFAEEDLCSYRDEQTIKLYFADENNRYLLPELRQTAPAEATAIARYIIEQLLQGPTQGGRFAVMPKDTQLIELTIQDRVCTVDLSASFLENCPQTETAERMTIYSIVNSLTSLDEIDYVRFLCEGEPIEIYHYMCLDQPLSGYPEIVGPVRYGLNETDATIYLGCWSSTYIATVPICIRQTMRSTQEELLLQTLFAFQPPDVYYNLIPANTQVLSIETGDGLCQLDISDEFILSGDSPETQRLRVNALVATLCSLPDITSVQLTVQGQAPILGGYDLMQPLSLSQDWLFP